MTFSVEGLASRDKARYPTWMTTSITSSTPFVHAYRNLILKFRWTYVTFITDVSSNPFFSAISKAVYRDLSELRDLQLQIDNLKVESSASVDFYRTLELFRRSSRGEISELSHELCRSTITWRIDKYELFSLSLLRKCQIIAVSSDEQNYKHR